MWKNTTSYAQGDKERTPTTWTRDFGAGLKITVTSSHRIYQEEWVMHCQMLGIDTKPMGISVSEPAEDAQREATRIVRNRLKSLYNVLP